MPIDIHMKEGENLKSLNDLLDEQFGFRGVYLFEQFCNLAAVGDYCDICTKEAVYLNAIISKSVLSSIKNVDGMGMDSFDEATGNVPIVFDGDKGTTIHFRDIVAIYPMSGGEPGVDELLDVDMDDADDTVGKGDRTVRDMIADHYNCKNDKEIETFVRRYLAS